MAVAYSQNGVIVRQTGTNYKVIGDKEYRTVIMPDGKEWLAENLDLRLSSYDLYFDNDEATYGWNGRKYGLLYNNSDCQIILNYLNMFCPEWRLPTEVDWNGLISSVNNDVSKLKSAQYWTTPGTDDYGFSAMPSGVYDSGFYSGSFIAYIYTNYSRMYLFSLSDNSMEVINWSDSNRISIRLVRDAS